MRVCARLRLPGGLSTRAAGLCQNMFAFACWLTAEICAHASHAGLLMRAFVKPNGITQILLSCICKDKLTKEQEASELLLKIVKKTRRPGAQRGRFRNLRPIPTFYLWAPLCWTVEHGSPSAARCCVKGFFYAGCVDCSLFLIMNLYDVCSLGMGLLQDSICTNKSWEEMRTHHGDLRVYIQIYSS